MSRDFNQAPGGAKLWKVGDKNWHLAYQVPNTRPPVWMTWKVESGSDLQAITGESNPEADRTLSGKQFRAIGAMRFGSSEELVNYDEEPFSKLVRDYEIEANVQPWLRDPEVLAQVAGAMLEGRSVTQAELASTDYWQRHSEAQREWMMLSATDPRAAAQRRADSERAVKQMLRESGISDVPDQLVRTLGGRWASGSWTESMINDQIRGLADPYAGIELAQPVINAAKGFDATRGDSLAMQGGESAVRDRIKAIFDNRGIPLSALDGDGDDMMVEKGPDAVRGRVAEMFNAAGMDAATEQETAEQRIDRITQEVVDGRPLSDVRRSVGIAAGDDDVAESENQRLERITQEVMNGRAIDDVRRSVDLIAGTHPLTGSDVTREGEGEVRQLVQDWLGPAMASQYGDDWTRNWAGRIRNDPDAGLELEEELRQLRLALFPEWQNENIRYADVAPAARSVIQQTWGKDLEETDPFFLDILRMSGPGGEGLNAAQKKLRREGLDRGIAEVEEQAMAGMLQATGGSVRRPMN